MEHGDVTTEHAAFWHPALSSPPAAYAGPPRPLHGDFAAEHVLLDEQGLPTGVIDWTDARLGDPALDLAGLVYWADPALLEAAVLAYGGVDAATLARARWYAACRALEDLDFGHATVRHEYTNAGRRALVFLARP